MGVKQCIFTVSSLLFLGRMCFCFIELDGRAQSFSSAIKGFLYKNMGEEVTLYEHKFHRFGYISEQWFTGAISAGANIRIYIDGEKNPSLDYDLFMAHAVPSNDGDGKPRADRTFGRLASNGGYFNTFRIPFRNGVKVTVTNRYRTGLLWYIIRGITGVPLTVGTFKMPNDTRLRLVKKDQVIGPLSYMELSKTVDKSGMLFLVTLSMNSKTQAFMHGCVRSNIDNKNEAVLLSSGTDDFFLSAFHFDEGIYTEFDSGVTLIPRKEDPVKKMVAFKFFLDDGIVFRNYFRLSWRNDEDNEGGCGKPRNLKGEGIPEMTSVLTYVWLYEWNNK